MTRSHDQIQSNFRLIEEGKGLTRNPCFLASLPAGLSVSKWPQSSQISEVTAKKDFFHQVALTTTMPPETQRMLTKFSIAL